MVVDQIRCIGRDPKLIRETVQQVQQQLNESQRTLMAERTILQRQVSDDHGVLQAASALPDAVERVTVLATVQERLRVVERRLSEVDSELTRLEQNSLSDNDVALALREFDQLWQALAPREQSRILELLIERVDYDGERGQVSLTFRPCGIRSLTQEFQEAA